MNSGNCKLQRAYSNSPALALPGMAGKLLNTFLPIKEYFQFQLFIIILSCNKTAKPSSLKRINQFKFLCPTFVQARKSGRGKKKKKRERIQQDKGKGKLAFGAVCFSLLCVTTSGPTWELYQTGWVFFCEENS